MRPYLLCGVYRALYQDQEIMSQLQEESALLRSEALYIPRQKHSQQTHGMCQMSMFRIVNENSGIHYAPHYFAKNVVILVQTCELKNYHFSRNFKGTNFRPTM